MSETLAHGQERNRHTETSYGRTVTYRSHDGQEIHHGPGSSVTQTVSERWCSTCQRWVICRGIVGHIACSGCNEGW